MAKADGPTLLAAEISRREMTQEAVGKVFGVSKTTLHFWLKGTHRPSGLKRELIEEWSDGRVPKEVWLSLEDREALAAARKAAKARKAA
ncbi:MAG TPA: helix-turn-helix transcriptional regulator [Polyangiaceae bacterium]|nr:helix-turn-helix transcriptional regulator [Polyangiaceae bacterium]